MADTRRRTQRTSSSGARQAARNAAAAGATGVSTTVGSFDTEDVRAGKLLDWQKEMKYINHDLRELLIISAILFALLFIVGFFI